jgi:hypothetical protein
MPLPRDHHPLWRHGQFRRWYGHSRYVVDAAPCVLALALCDRLHQIGPVAPHQRKNSTAPVSRLYIAPAISIAPDFSRSASTVLRRRMSIIVSSTFLPCHRVYKTIVLAGTFALIFGCVHGRAYLGKQPREISEPYVVDRTLDRATCRMPHYEHDLCSGYLACEFHTSEDVVVSDVSSHASH